MKTLVVVESPKKAREIQKYLGNDYIVRASQGHVVDLVSTKTNRLGVDVHDDFKPTYAIIPEKKDKLASILDALKETDKVYLASDPDREGESIAVHIANEILSKKKTPIRRVLFHEITKKGILAGISKPIDLNLDLFEAQQARRVLDRLVGFMVSPFLIESIGPNLSAGRVQSVALRIIVDREREIENFIPEEYWPVTATFSKGEKFVAKLVTRITNEADAVKTKADLEKDSFTVVDVIAEEKVKKPPPPLTTATLQQIASRKYKLSSERTMKAAQSLYESGLVTYIRTDSIRCSPESVSDLRNWLSKNGYRVPESPYIYAAKGNAQDAHEAIRPTNLSSDSLKALSDDEEKVYNIILERFIASQMIPALYDTVACTIRSSSGYTLKAHGRTLKQKGWLEISKDSKDEDDSRLPPLVVGDVLKLVAPKIKTEKKQTQPPVRYKNHSLVQELEARGIGRPSTYANIIGKITDRNYVQKNGDIFVATDLGKKVVDLLVKFFEFMQYEYTAQMENKLDLIADGKLNYLGMMNSFFPSFVKQLKMADQSNHVDYGINCSVCSSSMILKHGRFGYYMLCSSSPDCKHTDSCEIIDGKPVIKQTRVIVEDVKCPKCSSGMTIRDGKFGKFYSCSAYPKCTGSAKIPSGHKCHNCGYDMYITIFGGVSKLACMGYPYCKTIRELPDDTKIDWIDPKQIHQKKNKLLDKIISPKKRSKQRKGS